MNVRNLISGARFRHDVKLAKRRGKDMSKLRELILLLTEGGPLPSWYKDHPLSGEWKHYRDCHIEPDWSDYLRISNTSTLPLAGI